MRSIFLVVVLLVLSSVGCQAKVDLTTGLEVVDVSSGWVSGGDVNGQNKIVPSASFRLKNVSGQLLSTLQANVLFRRVGDETEWGSSYLRIVGSDGLAPGAVSDVQRVISQKGYTGTETRPQILQNSQFADARVLVYAKYGSTQWVRVGEFVVDRRLLAK